MSVVATGFSFVPQSVGLTGRWVLLTALAIYVLTSAGATQRMHPAVSIAIVGYLGWALFTCFWSEVPSLSWAKAGALVLTTFGAGWGGHAWIHRHRPEHALSFLWPTAAVAMIAGTAGGGEVIFEAGDRTLYAGATINPNFLGTIVAMSLPAIVWMLYRNWKAPGRRFVWGLLAAIYVGILYLAASRGAYLIAFGMTGGLLLGVKPRRWVMVLTALVWAAGLMTAVAPDLAGDFITRNIYKEADAELGVFHRREVLWTESYEAAVAGGMTGFGYGVSRGGDISHITSAVSVQYYSREKGSSQLAIAEETGLFGLAMYLVLLTVLFRQLSAGLWRSPHGDLRLTRGLIVGTLAGMTLQSGLEAWWVGPGALEFVYFWAMAGAGLAMSRIAREQKVQGSRQARPRLTRAYV